MKVYRLLKITRFKESGKYYEEEELNYPCPVITHENKLGLTITVYTPELCDELRRKYADWLNQNHFVLVEGEDCVPCLLRARV